MGTQGDVAVVLFNPTSAPQKLSFSLRDVGFAPDTSVHVRDMLSHADAGTAKGTFETAATVSPHGSAALRLSFAPKYTPLTAREL